MTLTITIDDKYSSAFARRVTVDEPAELLAERAVEAQFDAFLAIDAEDARAALAADEALVERGLKAMEAPPEKRAAALAAFDAAIND